MIFKKKLNIFVNIMWPFSQQELRVQMKRLKYWKKYRNLVDSLESATNLVHNYNQILCLLMIPPPPLKRWLFTEKQLMTAWKDYEQTDCPIWRKHPLNRLSFSFIFLVYRLFRLPLTLTTQCPRKSFNDNSPSDVCASVCKWRLRSAFRGVLVAIVNS